MDGEEEYDSDSTVLIADYTIHPEKIARKRQKLDITLRRASQTNRHASDAENTTPNIVANRQTDRHNVANSKQWLLNKYLGTQIEFAKKATDSDSKDLEVKRELLENLDDDNKICVVISDDSDDDLAVVGDESKSKVVENRNVTPRINVLTPSVINNRRATLDSLKIPETVTNNADNMDSTDQNKVNSTKTGAIETPNHGKKAAESANKPSAIYARRSTFNCFDSNSATKCNEGVAKLSTVQRKNETNNDEARGNINKNEAKTNEHRTKPTKRRQNEISREKNSDAVRGKPGPSQIRISSPSKHVSDASVTKVKQKESTNASGATKSTDGVVRNQASHDLQKNNDNSAINKNDSNEVDVGRNKAKMNVNDSEGATVVTNSGNCARISSVCNSKDTTNGALGLSKNSNKSPVNDKRDTKISSVVEKLSHNKRARFDKNVLNAVSVVSSTAANNTTIDNNVQRNKNSDLINKIDMKHGSHKHRVENNALCRNVETIANNSENPVPETSSTVNRGDKGKEIVSKEKNKSNEKENQRNHGISSHADNCDQVTNSNRIVKTSTRKETDVHVSVAITNVHVRFLEEVKNNLRHILQQNDKLDTSLAPLDVVEKEINSIIFEAKKHGASEIRYSCPKCTSVSVYSPKAIYLIENDNKPKTGDNTCELCYGLRMLYAVNLSELNSSENDDEMSEISENNTSKQLASENCAAIDKHTSAGPHTSKSTPNIRATASVSDVSSKVGENEKKYSKKRSIENSAMNDTVEVSEKIKSNDKSKSYKRNNNDNSSPADPKRVRIEKDKQNENKNVTETKTKHSERNSTTTVPPTVFNKPSVSHSKTEIIKHIAVINNTNERISKTNDTENYDNNDRSGTQTDSKPQAQCVTKLNDLRNSTEEELTPQVVVNASEDATQAKGQNDRTKPADMQIACVTEFPSLMTSEQENEITRLSNVRLNEESEHTKEKQSDENSDIVGCDETKSTASECRRQNAPNVDDHRQNDKQYECKICKQVVHSSYAANKHKRNAHGHLDLKYKELFKTIKSKNVLKVTSTTNSVNTDQGNNDGQENNANRSNSENVADQIDEGDTDENAVTKPDKKQRASQNRNRMEQVNQADESGPKLKKMHKCRVCHNIFTGYGRRKHKDKHPELRGCRLFYGVKIREDDYLKTSSINNSIQQVKHENGSSDFDNAGGETIKTEKDELKDADGDGNEGTHKIKIETLGTNAETMSESDANTHRGVTAVHETSNEIKPENTIDANVGHTENQMKKVNSERAEMFHKIKDESSSQDARQGTSHDTNVDIKDTQTTNSETSNFETNEVPNTGMTENNTDTLKSEVGEERIREQKKSDHSNQTESKRKTILSNCYNCHANLDVNDIDNHDCAKAVTVLYNCFSCGVNTQQNNTHQCEISNLSCIENIQITNVKTVEKFYVFKCEHCNTVTDVYDDVIRHCQNHYNDIIDNVVSCPICQLTYATSYLESHGHLHGKDIKIINYSFKSLFSNWETIFDGIPSELAKKMRSESIYTSFSVNMRVTVEGPWQYTLYQCRQCETCVPPSELDRHCQKRCSDVTYQCCQCEKHFSSAKLRTNHESDHRATKKFKIVEFNSKKDDRFNLRLFEARKVQMESIALVTDIYKCQCGIHFTCNEAFKRHFVSCNMTHNGVVCHRCRRFFEPSELVRHVQMHHSAVPRRYRVNRLVALQELEPYEVFNQ